MPTKDASGLEAGNTTEQRPEVPNRTNDIAGEDGRSHSLCGDDLARDEYHRSSAHFMYGH